MSVFLAYPVEQQMRLALKNVEKESTWEEALSGLRAWRRVQVTGKPNLKPLDAGLTEDTFRWLELRQVSPR